MSHAQQERRNLVPLGLERFTTQKLPSQPRWERLSERVVCVSGLNPSGYTLNGTNTYLVGTGPARILIDTGELGKAKEYVENLEEAMQATGATEIEEIIITHYHHDHTGGLAELQKHFGNARTSKFNSDHWLEAEVTARRGGKADGRFLKELEWFVMNNWHRLEDGEFIYTEGATLKVFHTPGHAQDHIVLWLEEENALFTGDNVLGWGTTYVSSLFEYMKSLKLMADINPDRLYPAHGPVIEDGMLTIQRYMKHRRQREEMVLTFLQESCPKSNEGLRVREITEALYPNATSNNIDMAATNVVKILIKLEREGIAEGRWPADGYGYSGSPDGDDNVGSQDPAVAKEHYYRLWHLSSDHQSKL
eukprot:m.328860 g.328860  ORF g.328860 m.328860 type:complete len:363 (+) comp16566_c0_seq14:101-1189(+)